MAAKVLKSFENESGDHCIDVFEREDGTFGFEEYRRDPEDGRGWFPLQHFSSLVFDNEEAAIAKARATVPWLMEKD